ncbi:hypothetical protein AKJ38_00950 [candidate division MSBL1 archaeon SCGC-AAA259I14]|uniref:Uncharacterized protein n=1 Tax=candidate division MSBL1 archaeon SCGC-AAA259I14 TaxID=1698268 RepID=A0A133UTI1_9EURY|nr:hypothetical protein AKJ38_00950 [candidate division MSBL1 archaeon SCGC-AAA259I14]
MSYLEKIDRLWREDGRDLILLLFSTVGWMVLFPLLQMNGLFPWGNLIHLLSKGSSVAWVTLAFQIFLLFAMGYSARRVARKWRGIEK